jgi:hypothetical protein
MMDPAAMPARSKRRLFRYNPRMADFRRPIIIGDKLYRNLDEVPLKLRPAVEKAMAETSASDSNDGDETQVTIRQRLDSDEPPEIEVNGRTYRGLDEVPPEYRDAVTLAMHSERTEEETTTEIKINGRSYSSIDDVPSEFLEMVRRAMQKVPAPGNPPVAPAPPFRSINARTPTQFPGAIDPSQAPRSSPLPWILLAVAAIAGAVYLTLRH